MTKRILLLLLTLAMLLTVSCNKLDTPTTGTSGTTDTTPNTPIVDIVQYCQMNGLEEYIEESNQLKESGLYPNFFISAEQLIKIGNFKYACTELPKVMEAGKPAVINYHFTADPIDETDHKIQLDLNIFDLNHTFSKSRLLEKAKAKEESEFFKIIEDSTTYDFNPILAKYENYGFYEYYLKDCDALIQMSYEEERVGYPNYRITKTYHATWMVGELSFSINFNFYIHNRYFTDSFDELSDWLKEFTYINNVKNMIEEINQSILSEAK